MPRQSRPNKSTPQLKGSTLTMPGQNGAQIMRVGSATWCTWLATATHFYVQHPLGGFACRKQRAQRGSPYWIAYRRSGRRVYRAYIGSDAALDLTTIDAAAVQLAQKTSVTHAPSEAPIAAEHYE